MIKFNTDNPYGFSIREAGSSGIWLYNWTYVIADACYKGLIEVWCKQTTYDMKPSPSFLLTTDTPKYRELMTPIIRERND